MARGFVRTSSVLSGAVILSIMAGVVSCSGGRDEPTVVRAMPSSAFERVDGEAPAFNLESPERIRGRYIIGLSDGAGHVSARAANLAMSHRGTVRREFATINAFEAELPEEAIAQVRRRTEVAYVEAVMPIQAFAPTNVVQVGANMPLDRIDQRGLPLDGAYTYDPQWTGAGVRVWIVDKGVNPNNPELAGRVDMGLFMTTYAGTSAFVPCGTHGDSVATYAAGTSSSVARAATINVARIYDAGCQANSGDVITAITWIMGNSSQPAVINLSFGTIGSSPSMDNSVRYAANHGVPVVVAAGNDNTNACYVTPAKTGEAITVGATVPYLDAKDPNSNWGNCVDIFAPMVSWGGTSYAAGLTTGQVAVLLQQDPSRTPNVIMQLMVANATQGVLTGIGATSPNRLLYVR